MKIELKNIRPNGVKCWIAGIDTIGHAQILAGKMKRPDSMSFSGSGNGTVLLQGLWRGRPFYGQVEVTIADLRAALVAAGCSRDVRDLDRCARAWGHSAGLKRRHVVTVDINPAVAIWIGRLPLPLPARYTDGMICRQHKYSDRFCVALRSACLGPQWKITSDLNGQHFRREF